MRARVVSDSWAFLQLAMPTCMANENYSVVRPPGTLVPKAFCFSRDVLFFNQTQALQALSADRRETLHSDQHMRQLFNASPKIRGSSHKKFYPR